jgi:hypothetical protein
LATVDDPGSKRKNKIFLNFKSGFHSTFSNNGQAQVTFELNGFNLFYVESLILISTG